MLHHPRHRLRDAPSGTDTSWRFVVPPKVFSAQQHSESLIGSIFLIVTHIGHILLFGLLGVSLFFNHALPSSAQSLEDGLMLWLKLDEGVGVIVADSSDNNNQGILRGGDWIVGRFGNAVDLINPAQNNTNPDWIRVPPAENQNLDEEVTLAAWVKPIQLTDGSGIITKGENITSYAMRLTDSGQIRFTANFGEPFGWQGAGDWDSFKTIGTDEWRHLAVTYDGAKVRFFIDGVKDNHEPAVDLVFGRATQPIFIGADLPDDDQFLDGAVDDVRIYNRALSSNEIEQLAIRFNQPPSLSLPETQFSLEGDSIALTIQASDPEGQVLEYRISGLPSGLNYNASTGLISGIIDRGTAGTYSIDIEVTDPQSNISNGSFLWIVTGPTPTRTPTLTPTNKPTNTPINTPTAPPLPTNTAEPTQIIEPTVKPTQAPTVANTPTPNESPPPDQTNVPPKATATPTEPSELEPSPTVVQTFRHFEDKQLDSRISTGDRLLFQTTITNSSTVALTNVQVSQVENSELSLVPNSIWIVDDESGSGNQLANASLPLNVSIIPVGTSISVLYVMEVRLSRSIQTERIESIASVQIEDKQPLFTQSLLIPITRPPSGLSIIESSELFVPLLIHR